MKSTMLKICATSFLILFIFTVNGFTQSVSIEKIEVLQGNDDKVTFNFYDLTLKGMKNRTVQFAFVLSQNDEVLKESWVYVDPVKVPFETATWNGLAVWFYFPVMFLSTLGNSSSPYTGYLLVINKQDDSIIHKEPVEFVLEALKREITQDKNGNIISSLNWVYDKQIYSADFVVKQDDWKNSAAERDKFQPAKGKSSYEDGYIYLWDIYFNEFYSDLYGYLYTKNAGRLNEVKKIFWGIKEKHNLNYSQFAEMMISCIQNTVYLLPEKPYGILTPIETIAEQQGDCDSRSVLLYTLLRDFGYDVVIFYSEQYEHAMLGISHVGFGEYLAYKGKKYYFVETTAPGWIIGDIPPEWSDKRYWEVLVPVERN
ncbi:MAG: hypothetical protein JW904_02315 [Spirochaetales bacterium]|nr:hypothetical protein [Spirochaetales bacterium]